MSANEFTITGLEEILKRLDNFNKKMQNKFIIDAVTIAAEPTLAAAKANAPRKTGALASGLKLKPYRRKGVFKLTITRGPKTQYAFPVEVGHNVRLSRGNNRFQGKHADYDEVRHIQGVKFMRRAFINTREKIVQRIRLSLLGMIGEESTVIKAFI